MVKVNNVSFFKTFDGERWIVCYPDGTFQSIVSIVPFRAVLRYVLDLINSNFSYYAYYSDFKNL